MQNIFDRVEKKYLLAENVYIQLIDKISEHIEKDKFFCNQINNVYYDTDNNDLLIKSMQKPVYKEKVRVRSYGTPTLDDIVFLEIKKKYNGVVNKRRVCLKLQEFYNFTQKGIIPKNNQEQITKEVVYYFNKYKLKPKVFISYDRFSYYDKENKNFRITFDSNLRSRNFDLNLEKGSYGELYNLYEKFYIMELKTLRCIAIMVRKSN